MAEGAILHDSIASCVRACDVVITMVGFPDDVREVYMGEGGIFAHAREGQLLIDMTTSSPKLAQELTPEMTRGTILLLHCCNYKGFLSRSSDVMPQDGKNLNRVFPGAADGTPTQKLAAFLESEIIGHTDYLVDLHSGGFCEALVPHVYYHGAAKPSVCAESFRIAELTSAKFLVRSETKNGFYSHAGQCGVPAIILERGGCGLLHEEEVRQDLADVKNILRGLGFLLDLPAKVYPHRLAQSVRGLPAVQRGHGHESVYRGGVAAVPPFSR